MWDVLSAALRVPDGSVYDRFRCAEIDRFREEFALVDPVFGPYASDVRNSRLAILTRL